jgi:serine/threonine protein kinase
LETLADRIAREGPLNELDAVGWAIRLAKHLEALHVHGVAHGSISPACVLVQGVERSSKAILSDVRRTVESKPFHSPERIRDRHLSPADDTWALAATLYALMTGQPPFPGDGEELAQRISSGAAVPLAVYDVGDDDLQRVIHQALAPNLAERVTQVSRLREALERWHPDPDVGRLPALEDDDVGDEHEAATAMLPQGAVMAFLDESTKAGGTTPARRSSPSPISPIPRHPARRTRRR